MTSRTALATRRREAEAQHPPRVAVDAVLFTIEAGTLKTLLVKIKQGPFLGL